MSAFVVALAVLACVYGAGLAGMFLRTRLSDHHLSDASKDVIRLVMALIATLSALVLGLLIASAKGSHETLNQDFIQNTAKVVLLDDALAQYGPEASGIRTSLKTALAQRVAELTSKDPPAKMALTPKEALRTMYALERSVRALSPSNDAQRGLQAKALGLISDIALGRWMSIEHEHNTVPGPFLVVLVFWLSAMFTSFGLFAPRNAVTIAGTFVGALSLSAAIYLIEAMNSPLEGLLAVSRAPLEVALAQLGH